MNVNIGKNYSAYDVYEQNSPSGKGLSVIISC